MSDVFDGDYDLIAGTAWLFAHDELDQRLDYLFIDEAGQVSLAHFVAMGVSGRNIVLIGDQMQLAQPTQGVHPGESGLSALEYALGDLATVPAHPWHLPRQDPAHEPGRLPFHFACILRWSLASQTRPNARQKLVLRSPYG